MAKTLHQLILASQSPRRKQLLSQLGLSFHVKPADIDEDIPFDKPKNLVCELALLKAQAIYKNSSQDAVVIGSDTIVAIENEVLGKPSDRDEAESFLKKLSGNTHSVMSAVAILSQGIEETFYVETLVKFKNLTAKDITIYLDFNEYSDKAGAYGIQGAASALVTSIKGSYSNVVGLPQVELVEKFEELFGKDWRSYFV